MKKLKLLVLAMCASLVSSIAMAETKMGISAAMTTLSTSGSETLRQSGNVTNKSIDEDLTVPSLFIEAVLDNGFAVGVDYVPVAELGSGTGDDDDNETFEGAIKRPTIQVNKTRDITLGFIKLKNDCRLNTKLSLGFPDFVIIWLNLFYFR